MKTKKENTNSMRGHAQDVRGDEHTKEDCECKKQPYWKDTCDSCMEDYSEKWQP